MDTKKEPPVFGRYGALLHWGCQRNGSPTRMMLTVIYLTTLCVHSFFG
jgi:hypothetical protein